MVKIYNFKTKLFLGLMLCFVIASCGGEVDDQADGSDSNILLPPPTQLQWSPDGKWIVYVQLQSLHMMNTNTKLIELLTGTGQYAHPVWSPDGTKIAYDCSTEIWPEDIFVKSVQPNLGVSSKLTSATQSDSSPEWSPDGKMIAFQSHRTGNWDIFLIALDGESEPIQLTTDLRSDRAPSWSPDGKEIAFRSNRAEDYEIWVISIDDKKVRQLTDAEGTETDYNWSPDGTQIAYIAKRGEEYDIYVADVYAVDLAIHSEPIETRLTLVGNVGSFDWSPDGGKILYQSDEYVYCRNSDGIGEAITIVEAFEPLWSPDGERIAFIRLDQENNDFVIEVEPTPETLK